MGESTATGKETVKGLEEVAVLCRLLLNPIHFFVITTVDSHCVILDAVLCWIFFHVVNLASRSARIIYNKFNYVYQHYLYY